MKAAEQPTHLVEDKNSNQSRTCTRRGKHVQSTAGLQKSHLYYHNIALSVYVLCVSLCACIRVHASKIEISFLFAQPCLSLRWRNTLAQAGINMRAH